MDITIKKADILDALGIKAVNSTCLPISYSIPEYIKFIQSRDFLVYIAVNNDKIVGYIIANYTSMGGIHIYSIAVLESFRRHKIASQLIDIIKPRQKYVSLYVMTTFTDAIRFYKRYGFIQYAVKHNYYGIGVDGYEMRYTPKGIS